MSRLTLILTLFLSLTFTASSYSAIINKISFEGLTKTKESFLKGQIQCKVGLEFTEEMLKADEQTIRNLNLFFSVQSTYAWNEPDFGWDILFTIEEAKYLYPIFSISGFKNQFKLEAGFNHINFRGKGHSIGFVYQYYDRHSFSAFYNVLRHKNGKTGHDFSLTKYSTIEPLYFNDTSSAFNFDNYNVSVGGHYWINKKFRVGIGGMYMYENYLQLDTGSLDLGQTEFLFHKIQLRSYLEYNAINHDYEMRKGIKIRSYLELIETKDFPMASFLKFTNDFSWYYQIKKNGNLAFHNRIGIATNNDSPFSPFVLDGFLNVRGIGNRVMRGTAEFITNIEYRQTLWRHKWFILQGIAFSDLGTLRRAGESLESMFNYKELNLFLGGGIRLNSQILYKVTFRLDYSFNPINRSQHGLTFGVGQFF